MADSWAPWLSEQPLGPEFFLQDWPLWSASSSSARPHGRTSSPFCQIPLIHKFCFLTLFFFPFWNWGSRKTGAVNNIINIWEKQLVDMGNGLFWVWIFESCRVTLEPTLKWFQATWVQLTHVYYVWRNLMVENLHVQKGYEELGVSI